MPGVSRWLEYAPQSLTTGLKNRCVNLEGYMVLKMLGYISPLTTSAKIIQDSEINLSHFVCKIQQMGNVGKCDLYSRHLKSRIG